MDRGVTFTTYKFLARNPFGSGLYISGNEGYRSSDEIFDSIMNYEAKNPNGLNGFILLMHIGTDPRRTDKFYNRLEI